MRISRRIAIFLPVVAYLSWTPAQAADPLDDIAAKALSDNWAYEFLGGLTAEIGPRMAGSQAARDAAHWAEAKLKQAGFDEVHLETFPVTNWTRGAEEATVLAANPQKLVVAALGETVATPADGITAEIVLFKTYQALLDAPENSLKGKIAVVTQHMVRAQDGRGYGHDVAMRVYGPSEAARRGASALLIRSVGTDSHRLAHTGLTLYANDAPKIPAAALSVPDAELLERLAAKGPVKLRLKLASTYTENAQAITVVGEVKGREHPEQVVLLSGHLDSWDLGTGAIDDGAGVAIAAGAAKVIAGMPKHPKRTIRVVMFGAEEIGQSKHSYAVGQGDMAANIVVAGESDFGARKIYEALLPKGVAGSPFGKKLGTALHGLGVDLGTKPSEEGGADLEELVKGGVPVVDFFQDGTDYFDIHHTADDTFDKVVPAELAQNVAVWASFAWLAADGDIDFRAMAK